MRSLTITSIVFEPSLGFLVPSNWYSNAIAVHSLSFLFFSLSFFWRSVLEPSLSFLSPIASFFFWFDLAVRFSIPAKRTRGAIFTMLPFALLLHSLAKGRLVWLILVFIVAFGQSHNVNLISSSLAPESHSTNDAIDVSMKRDWQAEQGPFFNDPRDESNNSTQLGDPSNDNDKLGQKLGLPNPLSVVVSILGGSSSKVGPAIPHTSSLTQVAAPTSTPGSGGGLGGGLLGSVVSILVGATSVAPIVAGGNPLVASNPLAASSSIANAPLGGLLSALSQVDPVAATSALVTAFPAAITPAPTTKAGSGGLLAGIGILGNVASALDGVLGSSGGITAGSGGGLLAQISSNVLTPIASIAADPVAILANPTVAVLNLQSQVSAVLDSVPSAVAAGLQLASNVGGEVADALNATNDVLDSAPDVAGSVADQVGSLLNAAPDLATGLPAAALSAVSQVQALLTAVPDLGGDVTGLLGDLTTNLSSAMVNAIPEVTSLAAVVGNQVVSVLPPALQPLVSGVLSTLQGDVSGLLCQVSDVVGGTAVVFGVPCNQVSSMAGLRTDSGATTPVSVSASVTLTGNISPAAILPSSTSPPLNAMLSALSSSILSAAATDASIDASLVSSASAANSLASSALSGLSSLISQISSLSLTATTPAALSSPLAVSSLLATPSSSPLLLSTPATSLLAGTPLSALPMTMSTLSLSPATSAIGTPLSATKSPSNVLATRKSLINLRSCRV